MSCGIESLGFNKATTNSHSNDITTTTKDFGITSSSTTANTIDIASTPTATPCTTDPNTASAALDACTASGHFHPIPFEGGGIAATHTPEWVYSVQFRAPHTGIIYTPPEYSDHVAVSLVSE